MGVAIDGGIRLLLDDRGAVDPVVASLGATSTTNEEQGRDQRSAAGPSTPAGWTANRGQEGGNLGISVGTAGVVNGDGCTESSPVPGVILHRRS